MRAHAMPVFVALLLFVDVGDSQTPPTAEPSKPRQLTIANKAWTGDFDRMLERRIIRVYAPFSRSLYFSDKGRERGIAVELVRDWERYLNIKYAKQLGKRPLTSFKNHLDGYNLLPYLEGKVPNSPRKEFFYFNDDAELVALRYGNMKFVYCEQRQPGQLAVWLEPFTCLRGPKMFNPRMDPFERADFDSNTYYDWTLRRSFYVVPTQDIVANFLSTFKDYPPRQRPSSFNVDQIIEKFMSATTPKGQ